MESIDEFLERYEQEHLIIRINGEPKGKGRPRFTKAGRAFTPKATRDYEDEVKAAAMRAALIQRWLKPDADDPLQVGIIARFAVPQSWSKKKRQAAWSGEIYPTAKPDADNVAKLICDALNGIAYHDDSRITTLTVLKRYADEEESPCVMVWVSRDKTAGITAQQSSAANEAEAA